ncbi:MAG: Rpn family recombination-promoting nuclease/putative transposase [Spirochaetales bacterium]
MPYSPLTHDSVFLHVFGEPEGLPLLESLVNAHFEAVGLPLVHKMQLQPRDLPPEHSGEKLAILDILAEDETGRMINVEVQTTRKPAYFERALFYWARLFVRQLPKGEDYTTLRPVISLNFLEYEISRKSPWLHFIRLPHTGHFGFIFVELPKLLRSTSSRSLLKNAALWGRFLEQPEIEPPSGSLELVAMLDAAKKRMEAYMQLTPEVYNEIRQSMEHHDYASVRGEALREGEAIGVSKGKTEGKVEVAVALLADGMGVAKVAAITGLPLSEVAKL